MRDAARRERRLAGLQDERVLAGDVEGDFAVEDIERLVLVGVDVQRGRVARRTAQLDDAEWLRRTTGTEREGRRHQSGCGSRLN